MKCYKTNKTARIIAAIIAFIPFSIGALGFVPVFTNFSVEYLIVLPLSGFFLYVARFIIGRNFISVCIDGNDLIVNKLFYRRQVFSIAQMREIALFSLQKIAHNNNYLPAGTPQATGGAIGNALLSMSNNAAKNSTHGQQLALKFLNGKVISFNSNYMDDANDLLKQLKQQSGLEVQMIPVKFYHPWRKGILEQYIANRGIKSKKFLQAIKPFYKAKYLFYPPLIIFTVMIIALNIWFNLTHYNFKKITIEKPENAFFYTQKLPKKDKYDRRKRVDFYSKKSQKRLASDIIIHNERFFGDESDTVYHYAFYPYDNPFFLSRIVNLDSDEEPEIFFKAKDEVNEIYQVYDYNKATDKFDILPIEHFSKNLQRYITELKGYKAFRWSYKIGEELLAYMVIYYVILLFFHSIVAGLRKSVEEID
ncbi:MAG TPA: hypothetical protein ENJ44_00960 [Oceanospirillales bacterium]|nr:hypothetical protein [Oceanospirillales bacterium]